MRDELMRYRIQQYISDVHALALDRKPSIMKSFAQPRPRASVLRGRAHSVAVRFGERGASRVWELVMGGGMHAAR